MSIDFTSKTALVTTANIITINYAQILLSIEGVDYTSATVQYLVWAPGDDDDLKIYIQSSKIYVETPATNRSDSGVWTAPLTTGTGTFIISIYNSSADPVIVFNGTQLTTTEVTSPADPENINAGKWYFGAYLNGTLPMGGRMSEIAIWDTALTAGNYLTVAQQQIITKSKVKGIARQFLASRLAHHWLLDQIPNGDNYVNSIGEVLPNADVSVTWKPATPPDHYTLIDADDTSNIYADKSSDGLVEKIGFATVTIPTGKKCVGYRLHVVGLSGSAGPFTVQLKKGAGMATSQSFSATTKSTRVFYEFSEWSQSDIDGVEAWITANASITKDDDDQRVYFIKIEFIFVSLIDEIAGNTLVPLYNASAGAQYVTGALEKDKSYL